MSDVTVIIHAPDGERRVLKGEVGASVMELAVANRIAGIDGECGGACSCATCHIYVEESWLPRTGACGELESDMLDFSLAERRDNSRLGCQIKLAPELDGLEIAVAS